MSEGGNIKNLNLKNRYHKGRICLDCGGSGKIIQRNMTELREIKDLIIDCKTCNGRGWVKNNG